MADRLDALTVRESNGKSYWTKIGVAWPNKNGPGYIVRLDAIPAPVDGQFAIHLREPLPKDGDRPQRQQAARGADPAGSGAGGTYGDLDVDDDVPY